MSVFDIAAYLSLNENLVASICAEEPDWTVIDKGIKDESDIDSDGSNADKTEMFDDVKGIDKHDMHELRIKAMAESILVEVKDWILDNTSTILLFGVCLLLVLITCNLKVDNKGNRDGTVQIDWPRFIHVCKVEFFEYLHTQLDITKENAEALIPMADEFYTKEHFRESWHRELLKAVDYQRKVKERLEPLKREVTVDFYTYKISEYTIVQSISAMRIEFDDIRSRY